MKVLQILPELSEGGVERGVVDLANYLVKHDIQSVVMSNGGSLVEILEKEGSKHIKFNVCSKNVFSAPSRVKKLRKILWELNPDIIHVRSRVPAWLIYLANKHLNFKVISTVHGLNSPNFYSKIMVKFDKIICVSNAVKEYILEHFNADNSKICVIDRGIDLDKFNPANIDYEWQDEFKHKFNLQRDDFIIASIGRITQLKDYETLIYATNLLKNDIKNLKVLIVGGARSDKKEYLANLQNLVKKLNLQNHIIFTDSQSKIAEVYHLANIIVSASKKPESFGRSVAEALALNTPVVASNHGGVKDIIKEYQNGLFFEVGDFKDLASKVMVAKDFKFDGYNYIKERFSLKKMCEKTLKVYKEMV